MGWEAETGLRVTERKEAGNQNSPAVHLAAQMEDCTISDIRQREADVVFQPDHDSTCTDLMKRSMQRNVCAKPVEHVLHSYGDAF